MIGAALDRLIGIFSPAAAVRRVQQRQTLNRMYAGAEASRLTNSKKPVNRSADSELLGPFGADALRAWARSLVRDNAYAWGVVDTIVSSVVGCGITAQSQYETPDGADIEDVNDVRDRVWSDWCEVCDVNGKLTFGEIQQLALREIVEAGEVLIHLVRTPSTKYRGILRPVPLALELIEADRLATEKDTYKIQLNTGTKIVRGVEMDELGKPLAYWIYPEHPAGPYATRVLPERIDAKDILHIFRRDRIGQSRGVSWFAPVMSWLRDLGIYVDNEIQASAVASCFGVAITTDGTGASGLLGATGSDSTDANGNAFEYLEPAMIARLRPGEKIESINPGRPNSASEPWINLMLRGISVGTGLSYEVVSRNYSGTSYSSSRTSMLEDRRRFRRWQQTLIVGQLCQPVWDAFCDQASTAGVDGFPTMSEILEDRRTATAVAWQTPAWEWVDPQSEQAASDAALASFQSTYQDELGQRGKHWKNVFYQRAKEERLKAQLGLVTEAQSNIDLAQAETQQAKTSANVATAQVTGVYMGLSTQQWNRNRKAIQKTLDELAAGTMSEAAARVFLKSVGMPEQDIETLITDAKDGTVDADLSEVPAEEVSSVTEA